MMPARILALWLVAMTCIVVGSATLFSDPWWFRLVGAVTLAYGVLAFFVAYLTAIAPEETA